MKMRTLSPPHEEPLTEGYVLQVPSIGADTTGVRAQVDVWNGNIKHSDTIALGSDVSRLRFVKRAVAEAPAVDPVLLGSVLLRLSKTLPELLRDREAEDAPPPADVEALERAAGPLLASTDVLADLGRLLPRLGFAGDGRNVKLLYLAAVARLLPKPVSCIVKGPSGAGKSFAIETVVRLLPPSAFVDYTAVSPRYLAYCDDDLRHRIVVLYEAGGIADGAGAYIMRSLLSEGRLNIGTVDKNADGANDARHLEKEGPTALFTSTIRTALDAELETRALSVTVRDDADQSRTILEGIAAAFTGAIAEAPDMSAWHALQEWLMVAGERRVRLPFSPRLAQLVPCKTVRIRRDFSKLLALICANAILHQRHRERDTSGAVIATLDDYAAVRTLMLESFAAAQQEGLTPSQREAIAALAAEVKEQKAEQTGVSLAPIAKRLGIDKSAAKRRLDNPIKLGYVENLQTQKGRAGRYIVGDALPAEEDGLPSLAALNRTDAEASYPPATVQHCNTPALDAPISVQNGPPEPLQLGVAVPPPETATVDCNGPEGASQSRIWGSEGQPLQCCTVADPIDALMTDDLEREVLDLAEVLGYPRVALPDGRRPGPGEDAWRRFVRVSNHAELSGAMVALEEEAATV